MPTWDHLSKRQQQEAREIRNALRDIGVMTSVSQVAQNWENAQRWAEKRIGTYALCLECGWDYSQLAPEYRENRRKRLLEVILNEREFLAARTAARKKTDHQEPGVLVMSITRKDGSPGLRHLPVVTMRLRSGGAAAERRNREQVLTGRAWNTPQNPHLLWAEIPVNRPHCQERGIPCAVCGVYGATRLRRDVGEQPGFVCNHCVEWWDERGSARGWPDW